MFGSTVLEVAIGLTFCYGTLALVVSTVQEALAAAFSLRANMLLDAIKRMLDDLRCEALARRGSLHQRHELRVGPLTLLAREKRALYAGTPLVLTQAGFNILLLLCREHPHPVSRAALVQHLWGASPPDSDALKSHIYTLRKTLEQASGRKMLATILQLGYRLDLDAPGHG